MLTVNIFLCHTEGSIGREVWKPINSKNDETSCTSRVGHP